MTEPQQPQWSPPPQQPAGWGTGGVAPVERPMGVTLAAIFLIVIGALVTLGGACVALAGGLIGGAGAGQDPSGLFGALAGMALIGGLIILVYGILHIVAGAGILGGKNWARWTGIVLAVIGVIFGVLGLVGSLGVGGGPDASGLVIQLVFVVLYALTAWALFQATAWFAYRR